MTVSALTAKPKHRRLGHREPIALPATTTPAIDADHLRRMTLGEKSLEVEVLQLFDRQAAILLARMRDAAPKSVVTFAHTLKGSAQGVGAWLVVAAAEAVERAGNEGESLAEVIERLSIAIGETRTAIAALLAPR